MTKSFWLEQLDEQERWIREHGGDESGYIAYYGSEKELDHYGYGGEMIFAADMAYLMELEKKVMLTSNLPFSLRN